MKPAGGSWQGPLGQQGVQSSQFLPVSWTLQPGSWCGGGGLGGGAGEAHLGTLWPPLRCGGPAWLPTTQPQGSGEASPTAAQPVPPQPARITGKADLVGALRGSPEPVPPAFRVGSRPPPDHGCRPPPVLAPTSSQLGPFGAVPIMWRRHS